MEIKRETIRVCRNKKNGKFTPRIPRKRKWIAHFRIEKPIWDRFYAKYGKDTAQKLRELIAEDLLS
jgi:hypothetical protein